MKFETTEGSQMNLDVSPNGKLIAFDLLGDIYTLPISGGKATRITSGSAWDKRPVWSPDGKTIAFISDRMGHDEVFTLDFLTGEVRALPVGKRDANQQRWAEEGRIRFTEWLDSERLVIDGWSYPVLASNARHTKGQKFASDSYFGNAKGIYYLLPVAESSPAARRSGESWGGYEVWSLRNGVTRNLPGVVLKSAIGLEAPSATNNGRWIVYRDRSPIKRSQDSASDYVPTSEETDLDTVRAFDTRRGTDKLLIGPGVSAGWRSNGANRQMTGYPANTRFDTSADSKALYIAFGGQIHKVDIATGSSTLVPLSVHVDQCLETMARGNQLPVDKRQYATNIRNASLSADGKSLLFASGRRIYLRDLASGSNSVLVNQETGQFQPSYSPDGKWIAFVTWADAEGGHLWKVRPDGSGLSMLTSEAGYYQTPTWSPDGKSIAFVGSDDRLLGRSGFDAYVSRGTLSIVDLKRGTVTNLTVAVRFGTQVSFSGDGSRIYYSPYLSDFADPLRLSSAKPDGTDSRDEEVDRFFEIRGLASITVDPTRTTLAAVKAGNLYLVDCATLSKERRSFLPEHCREIRLTATGGNDPIWRDSGQILEWSFADTYYRARLRDLLDLSSAVPKQDISAAIDTSNVALVIKTNLTLADGAAQGSLLLKGAKIISMRGQEVIDSGKVLIKDNRIQYVGAAMPPVPSDTRIIDVTGKIIIPGLIDAHAHLVTLPRDILAKNYWQLLVSLALGTTTAKDPSNGGDHGFAYAELVESGEMVGPRLISTTAMAADRIEPLNSFQEAKNRARRLQRLGARFVKYHTGFNRQQRDWIIQSGRSLGMSAASHMPTETLGSGQLNFSTIVDGTTSSEHELTDAYDLFADVSQFIRQSRVYLCFAPLAANGGYQDRYWAATTGDPRMTNFYRGQTPPLELPPVSLGQALAPLRQEATANAKFLAALSKDSDNVLIGSHGDYNGIEMHWEMWAHVRGGMSERDVLRAATLSVAKSLNVDTDLGSLEPGKLADLLILNKDPLEDIRNTLSIELVMKDGVLRDSASLAEIWPKAASLPAWEMLDQKRSVEMPRTESEHLH